MKNFCFRFLLLVALVVLLPTQGWVRAGTAQSPATQAADKFHNFDEIKSGMEQMASSNPDYIQVIELGRTYGDRPILAMKISDNAQKDEDENRVLFVGTHHAQEWISTEMTYKLAQYLATHLTDPEVRPLIEQQEIYLIPVLNPDGYIYTGTNRDWRKNRNTSLPAGRFYLPCNGVDLNRNYASEAWGQIHNVYSSRYCHYYFAWEEPFGGYKEQDTYNGPYAFSESETLSLRQLLYNRRMSAVISYHSFGQNILYPYGYTGSRIENTADYNFVKQLADEMEGAIFAENGLHYQVQQSATLYGVLIAGDLTDWVYDTYGIPALTIELRPDTFLQGGFDPPVSEIAPTFEENLKAALLLANKFVPKIVDASAASPLGVGSYSGPYKVSFNVTGFRKGLTRAAFSVKVGGLAAQVVSAASTDVNAYRIEMIPPKQAANGVYDLEVIVGDTSARAEKAISYGDSVGVDVMLVIDRSGSMSGGYLESAKSAASQFVTLANAGDQVGLVSFESSSNVNYNLAPLNNESALLAAINSLYPGGMTAMGQGLMMALDQLKSHGQSDHAWAIVLLSDGYENVTPYAASVLPSILATKTTVHTIALGPSSDQNLLRNLAEQTGGTYSYAPDANALATIYNTISRKVSGQQVLFQQSGSLAPGEQRAAAVALEDGVREATFSVTWDSASGPVLLTLVDPSDVEINPGNAGTMGSIGFSQGSTYMNYQITGPAAGEWQARVQDNSGAGLSVAAAVTYHAQVTAHSDTTLSLLLEANRFEPGSRVHIGAVLTGREVFSSAVVRAEVSGPGGEVYKIDLVDDGQQDDGAAGDGVYGGILEQTTAQGLYRVSLTAVGTTPAGYPLARFTEESFEVVLPPRPLVEVSRDVTLGNPGQEVTARFTVTNRGTSRDTFDLVAGAADLQLDWVDFTTVPALVSLWAGQSQTLSLQVTLPKGMMPGEMLSLPITATSQTNPDVYQTGAILLRVPNHPVYLPLSVGE